MWHRKTERDVKVWKCIVVYGEPFPHRDEWGLSESERAGRAGIERCWCPTGKARAHFPPQLSLLLWMLRVEEKGLSDPQLAVSRLVLCPNQLQVTLRLTTCPSPHPSVRDTEERVAEINRSLNFASEYISSYFIQKGAFLRAFCAVHLCISAFILKVWEVYHLLWEDKKT